MTAAIDTAKKHVDRTEKGIMKSLRTDLADARPRLSTTAKEPKKMTSVCRTGREASELPMFVPPSLKSTPQQEVITLGSTLLK